MIYSSVFNSILTQVQELGPLNSIELFLKTIEITEKFSHILSGQQKEEYCRIVLQKILVDIDDSTLQTMISTFFELAKDISISKTSRSSCKNKFFCFRA